MIPDLQLPDRPAKPRRYGRTSMIDRGSGLGAVKDVIASAGPYLDLVKVGWGTAVVDPLLEPRLELYGAAGIEVCFGGTLFEVCFLRGQLDGYRRWLQELGVEHVEISDGTLELETADKLGSIEAFSEAGFTVHSEVGSKDSATVVSPKRWVKAIREELDAGATYVILEGRESASAGLYRPGGEIRTGLIEEILSDEISVRDLVFEAPVKPAQAFLLDLLGPNVNLANIASDDIVALETLRLGLRSDTLLRIHGG